MRIGAETSPFWSPASQTAAGHNRERASSTSPTDQAGATAGTDASSPAEANPIDFNSATRQELFDWMNEQIRSGRMSIKESTPFLGMTVKFSTATGKPVDMASDNTPIDFMERARLGIEGALSRFDPEGAERLRAALSIMQKFNTPSTSLDILA